MKDQIAKLIKDKQKDKWWIESDKKVIPKYRKIFHPKNLENLTVEDFKSFLLFRNNYHWDGIHRTQGLITKDMGKFKKALSILLDESIPLKDRLNKLYPKSGKNYIKGMGKAILTPILLVVYPKKYGVWNTKSEGALKNLNLFPSFSRGATFAEKYIKVNEVLNNLKDEYNISLWHLDGILGDLSGTSPFEDITDVEAELEKDAEEHGIYDLQQFAMEKHLEDFIISNWDNTSFGKKYELIEEDGDIKSQQYPTDVGPMDILAMDKDTGDYLVVELKKTRTSDAIVGQILRYMNWVDSNLAKGKKVKGAIIVPDTDMKLMYSLKGQKNIKLYTYKINFNVSRKVIEV